MKQIEKLWALKKTVIERDKKLLSCNFNRKKKILYVYAIKKLKAIEKRYKEKFFNKKLTFYKKTFDIPIFPYLI